MRVDHAFLESRVDLVPVDGAAARWFAEAADLYLEAFPPEERRDGIGASLGAPRFLLESILLDGAFAGFATTWRLDGFTFLEHVATVPAVRGTGVGGAALRRVLARAALVVAEAEPSDRGTMAARRLAFYEGLGLLENPGDYVQPSYGVGKPPVPMRLLSSPRLLHDGERASVTAQLEREVYGFVAPARWPGSDAGAIGRPNR